MDNYAGFKVVLGDSSSDSIGVEQLEEKIGLVVGIGLAFGVMLWGEKYLSVGRVRCTCRDW